jgi:thiamine-phosphate pyrophosphorylase
LHEIHFCVPLVRRRDETAMTSGDPAPRTQLFLVAPPVADASAAIAPIRAALAAGEVACLLLQIVASDDGSAKKIARDVAAVVQPGGTALILAGWSSVVARAGADGIHLAGHRSALREAIDSFKPERIVGAGGIRSRHDAMTVAEMGVDYVMFGEPAADGRPPPLAAVVERTQWWSELFEIPCVAFAPDLGSVPLLADAGADFVALGDAVWRHDKGAAAAVGLASALLQQREALR